MPRRRARREELLAPHSGVRLGTRRRGRGAVDGHFLPTLGRRSHRRADAGIRPCTASHKHSLYARNAVVPDSKRYRPAVPPRARGPRGTSSHGAGQQRGLARGAHLRASCGLLRLSPWRGTSPGCAHWRPLRGAIGRALRGHRPPSRLGGHSESAPPEPIDRASGERCARRAPPAASPVGSQPTRRTCVTDLSGHT